MDVESFKNIGEIVLFAATCLLPALLIAGFLTGVYCFISSLIERKRTRKPTAQNDFHNRTA